MGLIIYLIVGLGIALVEVAVSRTARDVVRESAEDLLFLLVIIYMVLWPIVFAVTGVKLLVELYGDES